MIGKKKRVLKMDFMIIWCMIIWCMIIWVLLSDLYKSCFGQARYCPVFYDTLVRRGHNLVFVLILPHILVLLNNFTLTNKSKKFVK